MPRSKKSLARPGEQKQKTRKGLEIPVPTRENFLGPLRKAAKPRSSESAPIIALNIPSGLSRLL